MHQIDEINQKSKIDQIDQTIEINQINQRIIINWYISKFWDTKENQNYVEGRGSNRII